MPVDAWPGSLPQYFEKDSYSEDLGSNVISSEPDTGPVMMRRRSTATPSRVRGSMILTAAQYETFRTFYRTHQAVRFSWVDVRGNARYYLFDTEPPQLSMAAFNAYRVNLSLIEFQTETGGA